MKKSTSIVLVAFCLFIATGKTLAQADKVKNYESTRNSYKNISRIGLNEFMDMDFRLIGYFPKQEQWNQIFDQIKNIPIDSLRYVDSLDVSQLGDSLYVKVYTQKT